MSERGRNSIVIVGGGASGVILAAHLLQSTKPGLRVTLIERRPALGQGLAYSTTQPDHLLNVSAMGMSALAYDPEHFLRWLRQKGLALDESRPFYAPRSLYASYLGDLVAELAAGEPARLRLVHEECVSISPTPAGVEVRLANGTSMVAHVAVLAVGHDEEPAPEQAFAVRIGSAADTMIDREASVLILGTGLSMVDAWLTLQHRGHTGEVVAVSRRGLLPSPHRKGNPLRLDRADIPLGTGLHYFVGWFRDLVLATERAGGNWRDVVDGVRPYNQLIWQSWQVSARRRFLEHTRAWWDIHRHRMAPEIHARVTRAVEEGRLKLVAGRVQDAQPADGGLSVTLVARQSKEPTSRRFARVYDCTGIVKDVSTGSIAPVRSLTDRGLARNDPLRLGLDVTPDCAILDPNGKPSATLYAIGPLTRGTFFEIDGIPDIRVQCSRLAGRLTI